VDKAAANTLDPGPEGTEASRGDWSPERWIKVLTAAWWLGGVVNVCVDPNGSSCNLTGGALVALLLVLLSLPLAIATGVWASRRRRDGKRWRGVAAIGLSPAGVIALLVAVSLAVGAIEAMRP
jgi:hypothetical protein